MIKLKPDGLSVPRYTALMGLLFAVTAALNRVESVFSAALPAGMRVGLSNIAVMLAVLCVNLPSALLLTVLKSGFVFLTRGFTAGIMSLCGSLAAFCVTALLFRRTKASYVLTSVLAAAAHSLGQLCAAWGMLGTASVFAYAPVLAVSSTAAGVLTGIVLGTVFPQMARLFGGNTGQRHRKRL
ncbi:MAG: Gx transporter family protein [Prevotella sp.]|nr:Gx transporter family protein [Prevotella sp.]